jgi:hypothetical protein
MNPLQTLIKKTEEKNKKSSFTVSNESSVDLLFSDKKAVEITYSENDLTKNYVKFLTDVFAGVFCEVTEAQVVALGDSIKASASDFKTSYQNKKSVIKEISDGVFIHTSMNSETMRIKIKNVVDSFNGELTWPKDLTDKLKHASIMADDVMTSESLVKRMYTFQFEKEHLEDEMDKKISPLEFQRFVKDFDSDYFTSFFSAYDHYVKLWKKNPNKYKTEDYLD